MSPIPASRAVYDETDTPRRRATIRPLVLAGAAAAAVIALVIVLWTRDPWWSAGGLGDAGDLTRTAMVVIRALADVAAVVCVGSLLSAAFLVPAQRSGLVAVDGFAALRTAAVAASVWLVASLAAVVFTVAEGMGVPAGELLLSPRGFAVGLDALEQPKAWLATALVVLVVMLGCQVALSWRTAVGLFLLAVFALLPVAVTGHSASGGSHDVATSSLIYHLVTVTFWVGGLVAVLAVGYRGSRHLVLAVHRFSRLALVCWVVMAVSGVVNALVRISVTDLFDTTYGRLVLVKVLALVVLGAIGHRQRRHSRQALTWRDDRGPLIRLAVVEVLVMCATIGVATALGRTPPPPRADALPSSTELLIGYDLAGPPTLARLVFDWRFDLVYGTAAVALAVGYLLGVRRLRRRGTAWPAWRTVAWLTGCALILVATSSGIGRYAPAVFSAHVVSQLLLAVLAPVLMVLGCPLLMLLRTLKRGSTATPGPREWLTALLRSPAARLLAHPAVTYAVLVAPLYLLYFSGVYSSVAGYHWARLAMNGYFLVAGFLFFWPIIGRDPAPRRLTPPGRLGMMFAVLPAFGFLAVALTNMSTAIAEDFYRSLDLPWLTDFLAEQRLAGTAVWAVGELPLLVLLGVTAAQWARSDDRDAAHDDATRDDELAAYNAMLTEISGPRNKN